jgi:hypothetical protein
MCEIDKPLYEKVVKAKADVAAILKDLLSWLRHNILIDASRSQIDMLTRFTPAFQKSC